MIERVIYVSRAQAGIGARDAYEIIRVSHNRNSRFGLTGALILLDGYFLQVLEGERIHLDQRLAAIHADRRHEHIEVRCREPIDEAAFAGDWMALQLGDGVSTSLREQFRYEPGFPCEHFDAAALLRFAQACCRLGALPTPRVPG